MQQYILTITVIVVSSSLGVSTVGVDNDLDVVIPTQRIKQGSN